MEPHLLLLPYKYEINSNYVNKICALTYLSILILEQSENIPRTCNVERINIFDINSQARERKITQI